MHGRSRELLAAAAIACFIGAFALTPSEVRSRLDPTRPATTLVPASLPIAPRADVPRGDPFAPLAFDAPVEPVRAAAPLPLVVRPVDARVLAAALAPPVRLLAIAVGPHPRALIADGEATRLVAAGDTIDGATVIAVDDHGVTLAGGRHLALDHEGMQP